MTNSSSDRITITGYVTPRSFGPFAMPVPAQNSCLREYVASIGAAYALPQCENIFPNCFIQFFGTLMSVPKGGHVAMYSLHMIPSSGEDLAEMMRIMDENHLTFHFVLERKVISSRQVFKSVFRTMFIAEVARSNDALRKVIAEKIGAGSLTRSSMV